MSIKVPKTTLFFSLFCGLFFMRTVSAKALHEGAVTTAGTGSGRASVEATESPALNPATMGHVKGYYFYTSGANMQLAPEVVAQEFALSLTDNMKDTVVPTSLMFDQTTVKKNGDDFSNEREFRLAFGNMLSRNFSFGLGLNYKTTELFRPQQDRNFKQTNLASGILWSPNENFGLAAVADNILGPDVSVDSDYRLRPTTAVGVNYNYRKFVRLKGDLISASNNSYDLPTAAVGLESYMNRWLVLRFGTMRNFQEKSNSYGAGLGFIGPQFAVNYGYNSSPQKAESSRHAVDLIVPVW